MSGKHLHFFRNISFLCLVFMIAVMNASAQKVNYRRIPDGVILAFSRTSNRAHLVRLQVINDHIIRVTATPADSFPSAHSLMVVNKKYASAPYKLEQKGDYLLLMTKDLQATISLINGQIKYSDDQGHILLGEKAGAGRSFVPETIDGVHAYEIRQIFDNVNNNALYGLGENQMGLTNIRGKDITLAQHNTEAFVPFFVSDGGYGILWDNNSITHFGDPWPWLPLDSLQLFNEEGKPGALTATYSSRLKNNSDPVTRLERKIDYSFLKDLKDLPADFSLSPPSSVEWKGYIASPYSGVHHFFLYWGGYVKVWINGTLQFPHNSGNEKERGAWRQSWNPAEALLDVPMEKDKKYGIRIKWEPDGSQSFLSLKWKKPALENEKDNISLASEMGKEMDYYFIVGKNIDSVISGYRMLTGKAPIMPIWAYGFWQSREHYDSSREILNIVREFRRRHIPIDNIVQDWFYWKKDQWGPQQFDPARYPDPKRMIDSLHNNYHVHFMISVWPKFYTGTNVFREFWDKGWLYKKNVEDSTKDWVGYVSTFYDAFNTDAREAFWNLVDKRLFSLGVDAWWL
ncbi:MAG: TIM-barrel domain-containing protein, partial [Chitinophagaceae bacterium]